MKYVTAVVIFICVFLICSCNSKPEVFLDVHDSALIPLPQMVECISQSFVIDENTTFYAGDNDAVYAIAQELKQTILWDSGFDLPIIRKRDTTQTNAIHLVLNPDTFKKSQESYRLRSNHNNIILSAARPSGLHRGIQTFKQLLPIEGRAGEDGNGLVWAIPGALIEDAPVFEYRGAMLDVARHFFEVKDVKRYIDLLALYKINVLHLHLADDQGWRIEIKSWPKLTQIGGSTAVGGGKGGYYTQEQYKEIVDYALQNYITVIPEIDMPGHTNAALASYPELNCDNKAPALYTGMRVGFSSLCVHKEVTYTFIDDVIRELAAITPGEYIHLGGDESHATSKEDYNLFLQTVFPIVKKYDKKVMGWEDIESAGVDSNFVIQHWTSKEKAIRGIRQGARVVLSPASYTYLDMKYNDSTSLGLSWAGLISVERGYDWDPMKALEGLSQNQVMGIESPLWTETVETMRDIEYMAFPRIIGHAELGWRGHPRDTLKNYLKDLKLNLKRMDSKGVNYKR